jgi:hypothetical protein
MRRRHVGYIAITPLLFSLASFAFAVDGIRRISQTSTTVFPIVISAPGSYRLASNLRVASTRVDAIDITANNVTLDLNGFSIIGPGSGTGNGINAGVQGGICNPPKVTVTNVTVTDGVVTAMGGSGICLGSYAHVERVRALRNGGSGIEVNSFARIIGNLCNNNMATGIACGRDCVISGNTANSNLEGIFTSDNAAVLGNSASLNSDDGLILLGTFPAYSGFGKNVMENNRVVCADGGTSIGDNVCNGRRF